MVDIVQITDAELRAGQPITETLMRKIRDAITQTHSLAFPGLHVHAFGAWRSDGTAYSLFQASSVTRAEEGHYRVVYQTPANTIPIVIVNVYNQTDPENPSPDLNDSDFRRQFTHLQVYNATTTGFSVVGGQVGNHDEEQDVSVAFVALKLN